MTFPSNVFVAEMSGCHLALKVKGAAPGTSELGGHFNRSTQHTR